MVNPPNADVKSVRRTAELIRLLADATKPLRLSDIATTMELPKSSTHAMLHTLVAQGVLTVDDDSHFSLSLAFVGRLATKFDRIDIRSAARPIMENLSRQLGLTCNLGVLEGNNVVYVEQVRDVSHPMQLGTRIGFSIPAHATALGKVLVSELGERREAWLQSHDFTHFTDRTIANAAAMSDAMARYRVDGFAVDDEELLEGIFCIAAPVRNHRNHAIAALSTTSFKSSALERTGGKPEEDARLILEAAASISAALGAPQTAPFTPFG